MIAGTSSGSGKTTVTCALLRALQKHGKDVTAFKSGPDYIDPMFHKEVMGIASRNLDLFLLEENTARYLMGHDMDENKLAIIEGAMGYYDGKASTTVGSSYHLANATRTPTVLVVDGSGMLLSAAAIVKGFVEMRRDSGIKGVILNKVSQTTAQKMKAVIEEECGVAVLGYLPKMKDISFGRRHLGLITAQEIENLEERLDQLATQAKKTIDLDALYKLALDAPELEYKKPILPYFKKESIRIGIALDKAFCFYYEDNLNLLKELGAKVVPFSPLSDEMLPQNLDGLILGGGYPEIYAKELSANKVLREEIRRKLIDGLPFIAECGGFQYLQSGIVGEDGIRYPMCGFFQSESFPTGKLCRFGYIRMIAERDSMICDKGDEICAHEFHYWDSSDNGNSFIASKGSGGDGWLCVHSGENYYAGYPHIHFYSDIDIAVRFMERAGKVDEK